ncbi:hypothetical protein COY29_04340 [Candidatus Woesebacteria bacterium CG_4_10_14_0_2_um_filter_39_14]|uniref:Uncharacterized protein n=2 Tax=Candidatus Woeseibacteriota TaxID=1752722 RepID=A0A2M7TLW3_9BACT|nr:MAG: hypothetical protein COY29_04340 [Candidatus Woesebacteria bacterium CG_4_10_14_0_2_um_filter_39_14]
MGIRKINMLIAQIFENITPFPNATYGTSVTIGKIISDILPYVFWVTGILLLVYLLLGGLQLMFAAGDPKKVQGAWGKITNAVIGFVIIFVAYWVTQLIGKVFNIEIINSIFGFGAGFPIHGPR